VERARPQRGAPLPAKTTRPLPGDAVRRARLHRALDRLAKNPVTWIHASAGAGKTSLIATYLEKRKTPILWYDVDAGDADVSSLFHYMGRAAEELGVDRSALPVLRPGTPESRRIFARRFFEALYAALPEGTTLVFDNYQDAAGETSWNETFRELCTALTARVRILVASRAAPPPPLARFQAAGVLHVLDDQSLRLDEEETRAFLEREAWPRASVAAGTSELLSLTQGWAVAVALLAKSRAARARLPRGAEKPVEGSLDAVFKFMAGDVFDRLDDATRTFLMRVSLLPSLTALMATKLTGRADAGELLARLHAEHLLVERQGELGFRFHDLFRMFLLERGRTAFGADEWNALRVRAAGLLAEAEQFQPAVELLSDAASFRELGDLVIQRAPILASEGRLATIAAAVVRIPEAERARRPWLLFWHAMALLGRGGGASALGLAEKAFHDFRAAGDAAGTLLSWALVVQFVVMQGDDLRPLARWLRTLDTLAIEPPTPEIAVRVAASEALAYAFCEAGSPRSLAAADRAMAMARMHGAMEDRAMISGAATLLYLLGGNYASAREMHRIARSESRVADPLPAIQALHSQSMLALAGAELSECEDACRRGLALARESGIDAWNWSLLGMRALCEVTRGDYAVAAQTLDEMDADPSSGRNLPRAHQSYVRSWLALEQGDVEGALESVGASIRESEQVGFGFGVCQSSLVEVVSVTERGDRTAIEAAIARLDARLAGTPSPLLSSTAEIVKTNALLAIGQETRAQLRETLGRARGAGYRMYLGSRALSRLVTAALEHDIEREFALKLVRAYGLQPGHEALSLAAWPWPVKIRALGPLEIEVAGRPLEFGRKLPTVPLALLKVLVAATEPLSAAQLSAALWPAQGRGAPRGSLDTALYRLRRLLGDDRAIQSAGGGVALSDAICWTDVRALRSTFGRIAALGEQPTRAAVETCERRLLELYRGPFGAEGDPGPVARTREQLRRRFARAVGDLQRSWLYLGDRARRDDLVRHAAARDPLGNIERTSDAAETTPARPAV
jgi:LuxR family transcriptional regulator, maltose regulon positive regulatory protein